VATATIAYVEVHAGLARKRRAGEIAPHEYVEAGGAFERDWLGLLRVDLAEAVLAAARDMARRHPLRAADAIHLGSALVLVDRLGSAVTFVAADRRLLRAAAAEGLDSLNVEAEP